MRRHVIRPIPSAGCLPGRAAASLACLLAVTLLPACGDGATDPDPAERPAAMAETKQVSTANTGRIAVLASTQGTTPAVLGYNIAHAMAGSNAADWWRYAGVKAARVFVSPSDIEPGDDIAGVGDGVTDRTGFEARRAALRANAANPAQNLDTRYVNWSAFQTRYSQVATGANRFAIAQWFPALRSMGVDILVNLTASPSRFPVSGPTDYPNLWELWQHYYAQAFLLSRDYDVRRFSVFNEPNGWSPAITVDDWALRLRVCSDAIQSAVADMNARYGRSLVPEIFAPNTANGATKYSDPADSWGQRAVLERGLDLFGQPRTSGSNFHVYNYQKYSMLSTSSASSSGYADDFDALKALIEADTGGVGLPIALTEYNVRTGANYDGRTDTADSPADYAALGANSITLAQRGVSQLYLFKFGMTARSSPTNYPVAKNGTHYVNNDASGLNAYGGAAATAEVYRLFVKASGSSRSIHSISSTLGTEVFVQATRDVSSRTTYLFIANRASTPATVEIDVSALGIPSKSLTVVEEVGPAHRGGVVRTGSIGSTGRYAAGTMPAQSVWLVSILDGSTGSASSVTAAADTMLADGSGRTTTGARTNPLLVRADGTANGRRVAVLRFTLPTGTAEARRVFLSLNASSTGASGTAIQAHVYGLDDDTWSESALSFSTLTTALRQSVPSGNLIANNVIANQGSRTRILGQLVVNSTTASRKLIDVTDFVREQSDGSASFVLAQDHRWDVRLPDLASGDTQAAGIRITSREGTPRPTLLIHR